MLLLTLAAAVVSAGTIFPCTPTAVWDADGPVWCAEGSKIRLHGIAAREVRRERGEIADAGCKPEHPCPRTSGVAARDKLVQLLGGAKGTLPTGHVQVRAPTMACRSYGSGKSSRTDASCSLPGVGDLSCALVRAGVVARWREYGDDGVCR